uniref:Carboxypeptidase inhibitor n=1 Tax=Rhipicephalus sanguineus TaxID=34632 RepID=C9W1F6_RHISA
MKWGLIVLTSSFAVVIGNSVNECTHPNTTCYAREVCTGLGGKVRGRCFQGVCCEKTYSHHKTCQGKKKTCMPKTHCPSTSRTKGTCKGKGKVCCSVRTKNVCPLFGGVCERNKTRCHTLQKASKYCGKNKKCCIYLQ